MPFFRAATGALGALCFSISALRAETIDVKSGEHADFSRLVIQFAQPTNWTLGRTQTGYEFRPARAEVRYRLDSIFTLIPKKRIKSVEDLKDGSLFLTVPENFSADAFEIRAGRVVIDIKDEAPRQNSVFERPLASQESREIVVTPQETPVAEKKAPIPADLIDLPAPKPQIAAPLFPVTFADPEEDDAAAEQAQQDLFDLQTRTLETEQQVIASLSRAVSQGLLSADTTPVPSFNLPAPSSPAAAPATSTQPNAAEDAMPPQTPQAVPPAPEVKRTPENHIRLETAIDRARGGRGQSPAPQMAEHACLDGDIVNIATWGEPPEEGLMFATYRNGLTQEFDTPNPEQVAALAKYYAYLTFGAEARAALRDFGVIVEDMALIDTVAAIMDGDPVTDPNPFADSYACDSASALWALLASDRFPRDANRNDTAILDAFSALPSHLRWHIGPRLAEIYVKNGALPQADRIKNVLNRGEERAVEAMDLLDARIDLADQNANDAIARLETIVAEDGTLAAEALADLMAAQLASGIPVSPQRIVDAQSMARTYTGTPMAQTLNTRAFQAMIAAGDGAAVLTQLLTKDDIEMAPATKDELASDALKTLAENGDTQEFLKATGQISRTPEARRFSQDALGAAAVQLARLEFDAAARSFYQKSGGSANRVATLAMSQTYIDRDEPAQALGLLATLAGDDADQLRTLAQALLDQQAAQVAPPPRAQPTLLALPDSPVTVEVAGTLLEQAESWRDKALSALE
ncbi:hypothetical protein AQS8620_00169 [Aquimixticola soesokkakensis]|uniref:Uncharacterized protein n=2 Tax=Aquimixticola soesokkakensis TaxID=1519096 RepID=A0A1Y5RCN0_9RHOB|nr:hypothetical protein AQS8620_00169 [Aquimixticola soesokkakensis]